jgi:DNA-binding transcriptional MerR regulator
MHYSIGEVAKVTGLSISTLRYYDREGMFPSMERSSGGIRVFSDTEIEIIEIIECLKTTGMPIKYIKHFLDWCKEGDTSLQKRRDMFYERLEIVKKQMEELQKTMNTIKFKCWYYDTALAAGTEEVPKNIPIEKLPEEIQIYKRENLSERSC